MERKRNSSGLAWRIAVLLLACAIGLLQGCASPAVGVNMVVSVDAVPRASREPTLRGAIKIRNVAGGTETNPLWMSKVSDKEFAVALQGSLKSAQLLAADGQRPGYELDATLLSLEQPMIGLDLTVTCAVRYDLHEAGTGKRVLGKTVSAPYTATFSDAFVAIERLRLANEGSVRTNLRQLLDALLELQIAK